MDNIPVILMLSVQTQMDILRVFVMMASVEMVTVAQVLIKLRFN